MRPRLPYGAGCLVLNGDRSLTNMLVDWCRESTKQILFVCGFAEVFLMMTCTSSFVRTL